MPPRSWLAKAKTVHDIGGEFVNGLGGKEPTCEQYERSERKWQERTAKPMPVAPEDAPYFGCRMHDAGLLAVERTPSVLLLRLDSINASDFASYVADVLDLPCVEAEWPVDLLLHDPRYVRAAHAGPRGGLRFVNWERLAGTEFLYDWAFQQEGRVQWIAQLWRYQPHFNHRDQTIYLMVDCACLTADDRCAAVFAHHYGPPAARLYLDAVAGIDDKPIDFNVFDGNRHTEAYIRRRIAVHGFERQDFR